MKWWAMLWILFVTFELFMCGYDLGTGEHRKAACDAVSMGAFALMLTQQLLRMHWGIK